MTYNRFAYIYDKLMEHAPYDKWREFTEEIIQEKQKNVHTIIDLGCGTGSIAIQLAKHGYHVTGVDYSQNMLTAAAEKSARANVSVNWIQQDIRESEGFQEVDLFISYCDVMNYITEKEDISSVFNRVYNSLRSGGLFIFDIHSMSYVNDTLLNQTFADVTDGLAYIWDCEEGKREGEMYHYLTFFQEEGEKYTRFDEVHHQQTYELHVYKQLLEKNGFSKIDFYGDFLTDKFFSEKDSDRIFIIAEK